MTQTIEDFHRATEKNDIPASIDAHLQFHRLFYELSGHGVLRSLWNGWETRLRLYLSVDHRSYSELHDVAVEHERLAAVALEGDMDAFRRELADHFQSALRPAPRTRGTRPPGLTGPVTAAATSPTTATPRPTSRSAPRPPSTDIDERNQAYEELAATLRSKAAGVWLLHERAVWGTQAAVENFQPHPLDLYVLTADLALSGN